MNTSGLVLELYDDPTSLKEIWGQSEDVPATIKTAMVLHPSELDQLPDSTFALVMMDGEDRVRKYACVDRGNTELHIQYFLKHGHKLPVEAQKTAASNLVTACGWYGAEAPDELRKVALGLGTLAQAALVGPAVVKGTKNKIDSNLAAVNAFESPRGVIGGQVVTPDQQNSVASYSKQAEATGTSLLPNQPPADKTPRINKSSTSDESVEKSARDLSPYVSVQGQQAEHITQEKQAEHYALYGSVYPLDSYAQVKQAAAYWDENWKSFTPEQRHEYSTNLVKRANQLGVHTSDEARRYGSGKYAPLAEIKVAMDLRRPHIEDERIRGMLDGLLEKRADIHPEVFAEALSTIDKLAEIDWRYDRDVMDPYASTFGLHKTAASESWSVGNDYVTKKELEDYVVTAASSLSSDYGDDFFKEFKKDPWGIFNSLPIDQKKRLARAATDNSPTGIHDVA